MYLLQVLVLSLLICALCFIHEGEYSVRKSLYSKFKILVSKDFKYYVFTVADSFENVNTFSAKERNISVLTSCGKNSRKAYAYFKENIDKRLLS